MMKLREIIRKALTKKTLKSEGVSRKVRMEEIPPSEKLVLLIQFSMVSVGVLTALEIAHLAFLGTWNSEIFAAITGPIGTITGLFVGAKV